MVNQSSTVVERRSLRAKLAHVKSTLDVMATLAVLAAAGFVFWKQFRPAASATDGALPPPAIHDISGRRIEPGTLVNVVGDAPVAIVEFADFECPFCARHAREVYPRIKSELIDTGQVEYAFVNFPIEKIHPRAFKASEAAECAGKQGRFWTMHDKLFATFPALADADLFAHARAIGVDGQQFSRCLAGETAAKVMADRLEGVQLGVTGTPAFVFGIVSDDGGIEIRNRIDGMASFEVMEQQVSALRDQRTGTR